MLIDEQFSFDEVQGFKFGYSPLGRPSMFSHVYFVDGLLIDTGHRTIQKSLLNRTKGFEIKQVFITHHHEDHTGNLPAVLEQKGVQAFSSLLCSEMMKDPPSISFAQKLTWGDRPAFEKLIPLEKQLETENHQFQIIPIPGHAVDMVALYEPEKKWLFSADLFISSYIGYILENESIHDQINSIKAVLELDFEAMFCAHNPQLKNPKKKLRKKLTFLEESFESVSSLYEKGMTAELIFKELKWKENWSVRILSGGHLSRLNLVKSIIRDIESN